MNVCSLARVRPLTETEKRENESVKVTTQTSFVFLETADEKKEFYFDYVFSTDAINGVESDMNSVVGDKMVTELLAGDNVSLISYGAKGSGKSHTLFGKAGRHRSRRGSVMKPGSNSRRGSMLGMSASQQKKTLAEVQAGMPKDGMVMLAVKALFNKLEQGGGESVDHELDFSFYDIHGDKMTDLLHESQDRTNLKVFSSKREGVQVQGLSVHTVETYADFERLVAMGRAQSDPSIRAHYFMQLSISQKLEKGDDFVSRKSKFLVADLAGFSQNDTSSLAGLNVPSLRESVKEEKAANKSLSSLAQYIGELQKNQKSMSFRNSTLTHVLKDALSGDSKTYMLGTVFCSGSNLDASENCLKLLSTAKTLRTVPGRAEDKDIDEEAHAAEMKNDWVALVNANKAATNSQQRKDLQTQISALEEEMKRQKMTHEEKVSALRQFQSRRAEEHEQAIRDAVKAADADHLERRQTMETEYKKRNEQLVEEYEARIARIQQDCNTSINELKTRHASQKEQQDKHIEQLQGQLKQYMKYQAQCEYLQQKLSQVEESQKEGKGKEQISYDSRLSDIQKSFTNSLDFMVEKEKGTRRELDREIKFNEENQKEMERLRKVITSYEAHIEKQEVLTNRLTAQKAGLHEDSVNYGRFRTLFLYVTIKSWMQITRMKKALVLMGDSVFKLQMEISGVSKKQQKEALAKQTDRKIGKSNVSTLSENCFKQFFILQQSVHKQSNDLKEVKGRISSLETRNCQLTNHILDKEKESTTLRERYHSLYQKYLRVTQISAARYVPVDALPKPRRFGLAHQSPKPPGGKNRTPNGNNSSNSHVNSNTHRGTTNSSRAPLNRPQTARSRAPQNPQPPLRKPESQDTYEDDYEDDDIGDEDGVIFTNIDTSAVPVGVATSRPGSAVGLRFNSNDHNSTPVPHYNSLHSHSGYGQDSSNVGDSGSFSGGTNTVNPVSTTLTPPATSPTPTRPGSARGGRPSSAKNGRPGSARGGRPSPANTPVNSIGNSLHPSNAYAAN